MQRFDFFNGLGHVWAFVLLIVINGGVVELTKTVPDQRQITSYHLKLCIDLIFALV